MADIFISYRRENGHLMAQLFYHRLIADGYKVFMDVEDLGPGTFDERLYHEIEQCTDFILILPPNALDRCQNPKDWVRMEIEHALNYDKNIIPILMQGFEYPNNLPESIQRVAKYNGLEAPPPRYYDALYSKLKEEFLISKPQEEEEYTLAEEPTPFFPPIDEASSKNVPTKPEPPLTAPEEKRTDAPKEMQDTPDEYRGAFGDEPEVKKKPAKNYTPEKNEKSGKPAPKFFFPTITTILIFAVIVYTIVWFAGAPQREIDKEATELMAQAQQMLDDGEYQSAIQILDRISTEWKKYSQVETAREQANRGILLNQVRQYETAGKYEQLIRFVQENIQDPETDPDVRNLYANAAAEYEALKLSEAEALIQQGDYLTARSILDAAASLIGEQPNFTDKYIEAEDKEVTAKLQEYEEAENYAVAIHYLNTKSDVVSRNSELQAKLSNYKDIYRDSVLDEAAKCYETDGYEAAIRILEDSLKILLNDSVINNEITRYSSLKPVWLTNLEIFSYGNNSVFNTNVDDHFTDKYKNKYSTSFSIDKYGTVTWLLNNKYETFTGTIACPEGYFYESFYSNVIIEIYCDGEKKYTSNPSGPEEPIQSFTIDVTNVSELKIYWEPLPAWNIWNDWCVYATIFDGMLIPSE